MMEAGSGRCMRAYAEIKLASQETVNVAGVTPFKGDIVIQAPCG
jgi:hypothetical protein